jgi:hypothetical protein
MGTDVHQYVEAYRENERKWEELKELRDFENSRSYSLFCRLAGVREHLVLVERGENFPPFKPPLYKLPPNVSSSIKSEWEDEFWQMNGHSLTWYTVAEMRIALSGFEEDFPWFMEHLDKMKPEWRIVIWFDC